MIFPLIRGSGLTVIGKRTFAGVPVSVRLSRDWLAELLDNLASPALAEVTILLLSEIATNAILHSRSGGGGGRIEVRVATSEDRILVEVLDEGSDATRPCIKAPADTDPGGRGLALVDAISAS
ncbi:ATP-binding protein [Nonomuraea sp. NPDC049714]|uniref:ATP-binding protein n=1 Tax=Nonomuraea sp. NPDC049714 TaxID=3364357 RepID=UPI0037AB9B99